MRPLIGITTHPRSITVLGADARVHTLLMTYPAMVRAAGAIPLLLADGEADEVPELLDRLDGIVFTGGGDLDPARYGGTPHASLYGMEPARDAFELALATEARDRRTPTLAICRGLQVINVMHGGTLIEDIASEVEDHVGHWKDGPGVFVPQHDVMIEPETAMADALGTERIEVNSIHHQAVRELGRGLAVAARAPDGVVEALEPEDRTWPMLAVQWHPEYLGMEDEPSLRLFQALVRSAR